MKITVADVLWVPVYSETPDAGSIMVKRHGTHHRAEYPNHMWMPAIDMGPYGTHPTKDDPIKQLLAMFILFNTVTVRDGIDVEKAHKAFLTIDEYRKTISPDAQGAEAA
jgi:hypothetical protein